jgi:hypothetical protein
MLSAILIYAVIAFLCFPVVLYLLNNAPTGWEDKNGFHQEHTVPDTAPVNFYHVHKSA